MSRENERVNRRYSVIRGRRARPVASARAKVEVFDNVRDAILDESESSEADDADDEEEGIEEILADARDLITHVISVEDDPSLNPWTFRVLIIGIGLSA